jgi:hypothetical protein
MYIKPGAAGMQDVHGHLQLLSRGGAGVEPTPSNSRIRAPALAGLATVRGVRRAPDPTVMRARGTKTKPISPPPPALTIHVSFVVGRPQPVAQLL